MTDATPTARQRAQAVMRELNERMKSPRGDYYQGDLTDPHLSATIVERALAAHAAQAVEDCAKYLETLAANHPHAADLYRHAAYNLRLTRAGQPGQLC